MGKKDWPDIRKYFVTTPDTGKVEEVTVDLNASDPWILMDLKDAAKGMTWEGDSSDQD